MIEVKQQAVLLVDLIDQSTIDIIERIVYFLSVGFQPLSIKHIQVRAT